MKKKKQNKEKITTEEGFTFSRPNAADNDFSDLIGKEVKVDFGKGDIFACIVDEIDYDIGLSISFKEITKSMRQIFSITSSSEERGEVYCLCLKGPSAPGFNTIRGQERYNAKFFSTVRAIRKGGYKSAAFDKLAYGGYNFGSMSSCAFSS